MPIDFLTVLGVRSPKLECQQDCGIRMCTSLRPIIQTTTADNLLFIFIFFGGGGQSLYVTTEPTSRGEECLYCRLDRFCQKLWHVQRLWVTQSKTVFQKMLCLVLQLLRLCEFDGQANQTLPLMKFVLTVSC